MKCLTSLSAYLSTLASKRMSSVRRHGLIYCNTWLSRFIWRVPYKGKKMQNEKKLEQRLVKKVKEKGGLCLKWVSPGTTGVPDRLVIYQRRIHPVELKDPKGKLSPRQVLMIAKLQSLGVETRVLSNEEQIDNFVSEL